MSTPLQTRLLRVLAEGEFYRVGGQTPISVDVRVIAATHQNLEERVANGIFREDLYHRLNVIRIELPPLRARREDIPDLLDHYLQRGRAGTGRRSEDPGAGNRCERSRRYALARQRARAREPVPAADGAGAGQRSPGRRPAARDHPRPGRADADWAARSRAGQAAAQTARAAARRGAAGLRAGADPRGAEAHAGSSPGSGAKLLGWGRNTLTRKLKELGMNDDESLP